MRGVSSEGMKKYGACVELREAGMCGCAVHSARSTVRLGGGHRSCDSALVSVREHTT